MPVSSPRSSVPSRAGSSTSSSASTSVAERPVPLSSKPSRSTQSFASIADQPFVPVVVGDHVGGYSLVRAFHDAYGVRSLVVTGATSWVVDDSAILEVVHCADAHDAEVLAATLAGSPFAGLSAPKI